MEWILDLFSAAVAFLLSDSGAGERKQEGGVEIMKMKRRERDQIPFVVLWESNLSQEGRRKLVTVCFCFVFRFEEPRGLVVDINARELHHVLMMFKIYGTEFTTQQWHLTQTSFLLASLKYFGACLDI